MRLNNFTIIALYALRLLHSLTDITCMLNASLACKLRLELVKSFVTASLHS